MKLCVPDLIDKIRANRAGVVVFVGKKIWEVFEGVAKKGAVNVTGDEAVKKEDGDEVVRGENVVEREIKLVEEVGEGEAVKLELVEPSFEVAAVKLEEEDPPKIPLTPMTPIQKRNRPPTKSPKTPIPKTPFDWHIPRTIRLPHHSPSTGLLNGYTYFWVTPSTSGLERTPVR